MRKSAKNQLLTKIITFMTKPLNTAKAAEEMPQIQRSKVDEIFTLVKTKEGVKIAIGNYLMCKKTFKDYAHADKYLAEKPYEILINVASFIAEQTLKNNEKTNQKN